MKADEPNQLELIARSAGSLHEQISRGFDPSRLKQARHLADMTKAALATKIHVSAAAIGQFEAGIVTPRLEHLPKLASALDVPIEFFATGRAYARVDAGVAHFRSLRSTRVAERTKALAYVEQVWELVNALETVVELPEVTLPIQRGDEKPWDSRQWAQATREYWDIPRGPVQHLVRTMELHGIVVTLLPFSREEAARVDAFSTSRLPRPIVVMTPDRADDIYRHRFTAGHELGHLLLHHDVAAGDHLQEREANEFAAELLTPSAEIAEEIDPRLRVSDLVDLSRKWGVSPKSLITRSRELGAVSESTARRAYQRLAQFQSSGLLPAEPIRQYAGEIPCLLSRASSLAASEGVNTVDIANRLAWHPRRVRELIGDPESRPKLRLV